MIRLFKNLIIWKTNISNHLNSTACDPNQMLDQRINKYYIAAAKTVAKNF